MSFCSGSRSFGFFSGDSTSRDGAERCRLLHGSSSTLTCIRLFVEMAWAAVMGVVAGFCDMSSSQWSALPRPVASSGWFMSRVRTRSTCSEVIDMHHHSD